jgi:hypothetical protein
MEKKEIRKHVWGAQTFGAAPEGHGYHSAAWCRIPCGIFVRCVKRCDIYIYIKIYIYRRYCVLVIRYLLILVIFEIHNYSIDILWSNVTHLWPGEIQPNPHEFWCRREMLIRTSIPRGTLQFQEATKYNPCIPI